MERINVMVSMVKVGTKQKLHLKIKKGNTYNLPPQTSPGQSACSAFKGGGEELLQ